MTKPNQFLTGLLAIILRLLDAILSAYIKRRPTAQALLTAICLLFHECASILSYSRIYI
ncbi:MAG: hypothetical protein OFPII_31090 [Osedax symbiont Rs1]|nr:MAG: hypothetical protein OFPII_31090 [Osedax symbiont Rs1]